MIVKINKWHEDSLYTFYIKEDVLKEIKDDSVYNLMVGSESALIDGDVYKLRPTTPESLLDNYFEVN